MPGLPFPDPPLADGTVALRPWRGSDVPQRFAGFADPVCLRFSWPLVEPFTEAAAALEAEVRAGSRPPPGRGRSAVPRVRDTVVFGLLPGELRLER
ncbi:hypothetical protein [Amycolatopsis anabasis]|uniref:hypothetical protein n=1 Tax=Amycolatopsis anabasis TaxID=1840409 RepID=UPI0015D25734|nr:hypothetical protein [Amycolatopsis anabasis]